MTLDSIIEFAQNGDSSILGHPLAKEKIGYDGTTPLHLLLWGGSSGQLGRGKVGIKAKDLRKIYPKFRFKGRLTDKVIDELVTWLNTPKSIRYLKYLNDSK